MTDAKEEELGTWKSVESYEAAQKLVKEHETNTVTKFSVYTSDKSFGKTGKMMRHLISIIFCVYL